ncbi:hypothetical protein ACHAXR_005801 [Thalassiosira sp. AJA248-18]
MKTTLAIIALSATAAGAFTAPASPRTSPALGMGGFLEGRGAKITIRDDEDNAMWIDDGAGGRTPSEKPKKPAPKPKAETKKPGFKFPWDK